MLCTAFDRTSVKRERKREIAMTTWFFAVIPALLVAFLLGACGTAPQGREDAAGAPAPGKARLYFYREAGLYDPMVWTAVSLNGAVIGNSAPGTVFYRDVAPGTYRVEARSDKLYPGQVKTVVAAAGAMVFVQVEAARSWGQSGRLWQGSTFTVAVVDAAIGRYRIGTLTPTPG